MLRCQTRALIDRATAEGLAGFHDRFDRIFDLKGTSIIEG
jgi:hypothetical protein